MLCAKIPTADLMKKGLRRRLADSSDDPAGIPTADLMKKGLRLVLEVVDRIDTPFQPQT